MQEGNGEMIRALSSTAGDRDDAASNPRTMQPGGYRNAQPTPAPPASGLPEGAIRCSHCGTDNATSGTRKFCGSCGAGLWEPCGNCGADVPVDERFCGHCGVNLEEQNREQIARLEKDLVEAGRLELECRFDEAIALLSKAAKIRQGRLKRLGEQAAARLEEVRRERDRRRKLAEAALADAQALAESHEFDRALRALDEVPGPIRTAPMQVFINEMNTRLEEIGTLEREIREAVEQKQGPQVVPKVERLLLVQPANPLGRQLAGRIRDQFQAKAEEKLRARQYGEALELLERIPAPVRTQRVELLKDEVRELSDLHWAMTRATHVDVFLKEAITRLGRLRPDDPTVRKMAAEFKARRPLLNDPGRICPPTWAKAASTPWECPVEWHADLKRIEVAEKVDPAVRKSHPGGLAVACGLALQGIGRAVGRADFRQADSSVLARVAKVLHEKHYDSAWGIDIGNDAIKAVKLRGRESGRRVVMTACEVYPNRKLLSQAADYGEVRDIITEGFDRLRAAHSLKSAQLCFALPGRLAICRTLRLPPMEDKRVEAALRFEVKRILSGDPEDYRWRTCQPARDGDPGTDGQREYLLMAYGRQHVDVVEETFLRLDVKPDLLLSEPAALHNFLAHELAESGEDGGSPPQGATALLDMGALGTNMVIHGPQCVWARYLGIGGHTFTRALLREFSLTLQQAEQWKRDPSRLDRWSRWEAAVAPVFGSFAGEVRSALEAFARDYPDVRIRRIVAVGGGFRLHGLLRYLNWGR